MSRRIAIVSGLRTPFTPVGGGLRSVGADDLGAIVARELLSRHGIDGGEIDEVVFGNVAQPAHAANIARVLGLKAGLPDDVVAHTVQRNCASGMQALTSAALLIQSGRADIVLAGGTESMSQVPLLCSAQMTELLYRLMKAKTLGQRIKAILSFRPSHLRPIIALQLGLTDPICGLNMGQTAELLARDFGITRDEQDAYALESHLKAAQAREDGRLADEIVGVFAPPRFDSVQLEDESIRPQQTLEALAKLRPYFDRHAGTVTAGNACPITDGAAALIVTSEETAERRGWEPLGYLSHWSYAGLDGQRMGLGPVFATSRLLDQTGMKLDDFDLIEMNEAFAAQVVANERAMASDDFARRHLDRSSALGELHRDRLNVNGGAIALGHPVGATGARLVITILRELRRRNAVRGLATLCVGGGQGAALHLEAA